MKKYITKQGDKWDSVAFEQLGDVKFTNLLLETNRKHIKTFIFSSGTVLSLPDTAETVTESDLPPWKRVSG